MALYLGICQYVGFFIFMILFMVISMIAAKTKLAWVFYSIGAVFQAVVLFGNGRTSGAGGINTILGWVIYAVMLVVVGLIIDYRSQKIK